MARKTRIPDAHRRHPRHRGAHRRYAVPARGNMVIVPRHPGGKLLVASVLGSMIALPVVTGAALTGAGVPSAGTASGPVRLTVDVLPNGKIAPAASGSSQGTGVSVTTRVDLYPDLGLGGGAALSSNVTDQNSGYNPAYLTLMAGIGAGSMANVTVDNPVTSGFGFGFRYAPSPFGLTLNGEDNFLTGTSSLSGTTVIGGLSGGATATGSTMLNGTPAADPQTAQIISDFLNNPQALSPETVQAIQSVIDSQQSPALSLGDYTVSGRLTASYNFGSEWSLFGFVRFPVTTDIPANIDPMTLDMVNETFNQNGAAPASNGAAPANGAQQSNAPQGAAAPQPSDDPAIQLPDGITSWPWVPAQPAATQKSGDLGTGAPVVAQDAPDDTTTVAPAAVAPTTVASAAVSPTDGTEDQDQDQQSPPNYTIAVASADDTMQQNDGTGFSAA